MRRNTNLLAQTEKDLWEREYTTLKVIPTSTRETPSKALLLFSGLLDFTKISTVLDVGCGIGRNSIYLARRGCKVYAIDFSETALSRLGHAAARDGVRDRIHICNCILQENFPFQDCSFDLVLDSYVFCHFTDDSLKEHYRNELHRVTKPGALVYSSVFSVRDSYYAELIRPTAERPEIVVDPRNGIRKQLYTEAEIKAFFTESFELVYFIDFEFQDLVLGIPYRRDVLGLILRR